jgi:CelD/BcsL family acetyltransferase involved in cellulose biosynthesis
LITTQESSVFHSPAWIRAVSETYEFDTCAYVLLDESCTPQAGIPVCRIEDMRGKRLISFPFSDYYDPLITNLSQWQALLHPLLEEGVPIRIRCLHNELPLQDSRFQLVNRARWHGMDIRPDLDTLWQQLTPECRRAIQKAERIGLTVRQAQDPAMMRTFFDMHLKVRKYKYQLLAQPYRFFENIWHHLVAPGHGTLITVHYDDQVVSAALFLRWQGKCYYKFGASRREYLELRPNDLLIWAGIQYAKTQGDRYFDLGLSDWDQNGLIAFKRKFATEEKTISFLEYKPDVTRNPSQLPPELLPTLTQLFTDPSVPDTVTERAGELLYRFFV